MTVAPVLYYSRVWPSPLAYIVPTTGPLLLLGDAFGQTDLQLWQQIYAVAYPTLFAACLWRAARALFVRHVIARSGGVC